MSALRFATRSTASILLLGSAMLLTSISLATPAQAADAPHEKKAAITYAQFMKMDPAECMKMMDADHNGFVTKKEFLKFQEQLFNNIPKKSPNKLMEQEWIDAIHSAP